VANERDRFGVEERNQGHEKNDRGYKRDDLDISRALLGESPLSSKGSIISGAVMLSNIQAH
jgi:hypothetical protein